MLSRIFNVGTANLYKDFSSQQPSQKILKVALPIIGLVALWYAFRYWSNKTVSPLIITPPTPEQVQLKKKLLKEPIPANLYNGLCDGITSNPDTMAWRWSHNTNQQTLVRLSTGKVYPANRFSLELPITYIMAESPCSNGVVNWFPDYFRMAFESNVEIAVSPDLCLDIATHFVHKLYRFLTHGEVLRFDDWTVECQECRKASEKYPYFDAYKLKITRGTEEKTLWKLLPDKGVGSFEVPVVIDSVDCFIRDFGLKVDTNHPLLVDSLNGTGLSVCFILFHHFKAQCTKNKMSYQTILEKQNTIDELLRQARVIEYFSTETAAIERLEKIVLPRIIK